MTPEKTTIDPLALSRDKPEMSARDPLTPGQKVLLVIGSLLVLYLAATRPTATGKAFILFSTVFYLVFTFYKFLLLRYSITKSSEINITAQEIAQMDPDDLPVYSILAPMYREPESAQHLVDALAGLDYPAAKKDVQLLLEDDDLATRQAVGRIRLPEGFRVTVVPVSHPRTKPKACNIGLAEARGKYLVIYDAEDKPERDQLLKVVAAFSRAESDVICLQSKLNFYNPRQNLLTRWFTAEYSTWFDLSLPGLSALRAVIPLGGTSNHFITAKLHEMLGWDAYNVTEDCDLGVRIYRLGFRSRMLNTTTWEEACSSLGFWIRQRTRWLKGYMQTYLVHMRRPVDLYKEVGLMNMIHFQLLIGGIVFSFLINPFFWSLALLWFLVRLEFLTALFPVPVFVMGAICLFVGNFGFAYASAVGCYKRGYYDLVKYALISPLYWIMMSYSGWRAFVQFFADPFYWEKTKHGLHDGHEAEMA